MMSDAQVFAHLFDYLITARAKLLGWIREQPADVYTRTFPIGMSTMRATLLHVATAEWGYTNRLRGRDYAMSDSPFTAERHPGLESFAAAWDAQRPVTRETLAALGDPARPVEYVTRAFGPALRIQAPAGGIAGQLLFHEVHHRAQIMAMLRQAGVKAENLDYSVLMYKRTPAE